jgi:DNA-binding MarR family transcriptional regulator
MDRGDLEARAPKLWQALHQLQRWQKEYLPGIDTAQGMSLLIWLLRYDGSPQPIGKLYQECRSSEPSMRAVTSLFVEKGLATLAFDASDQRRRMLYATPKLRRVVEEYCWQIERVTTAAD